MDDAKRAAARPHFLIDAIRGGFVMIIPILMIGAFSLMLRSLPLAPYQRFLDSFLSGALREILSAVYNATFGLLSVYITASVSCVYARHCPPRSGSVLSAVAVSLAAFAVLTGFLDSGFTLATLDSFGVKGMFTAIFAALCSSALYTALTARIPPVRVFSDGADAGFNDALSTILPAVLTLLAFAIFSDVARQAFDVTSAYDLFSVALTHLFRRLGGGFFSGLLYVLFSSLLWFCGVHGSDVLEGVSDTLFVPALERNIAAVAAGQAPADILTKPFFDVFVLIGGCGSALCLLAALLLFSRRRSNRGVARLAALPMVFNINELMVFGLPVIYNPILFIPFLLAPLTSYLLAYGATALGLVPVIAAEVEWTTPIFLGGYAATGSLAGSVLQLVCLTVGTLIYMPFIKKLDRAKARAAETSIGALTDYLKRSENDGRPVTLTALGDERGSLAKSLIYDLRRELQHGRVALWYQPQHDDSGACVGSEALLRWRHPAYGMLYPPLVIKIAKEGGLGLALEQYIIRQAIDGAAAVNAALPVPVKISVNVSAHTVVQPEMLNFLRAQSGGAQVQGGHVALEITEQEAFAAVGESGDFIGQLRNMGYRLAIDDFSMGHTSILYLQENSFDVVKLDGGLVRTLLTNPRTRDIISSIVYLSRSLGFRVCAEFVETEEQRAALEEIGCTCYQGYLYSPALPLDEFIRHAAAAPQHADASENTTAD